jgi:hypothetical protein
MRRKVRRTGRISNRVLSGAAWTVALDVVALMFRALAST